MIESVFTHALAFIVGGIFGMLILAFFVAGGGEE